MAADSGRLREACAPAHTGSGTRSIQVIAWRSSLLTGLRHGNPVHRCLCGIPAWRSGLQSTLRHSDPTHRYLKGIYAWRDHLLSTLLSRDPTHRYARAVSPWRSSLLTVFDTATLPTSTSVPSSRGKTVWNRCQTGLWPMPRPVFGTATLPTGTSRASMRGETIFYRHSCHETPAHRYSRAISPWRSSLLSVHSSMKWALFVDVEVWIGCSSMKWALFVDVEVRSR